MKVMLINPNTKLAEKNKVYSRFVQPVTPVGVGYIAAVIEKAGIPLSIIDQYAYRMSNREVLEKVKKEMPQVIGFSCLTPVMSNVRFFVKEIKKLSKNICIVLGNTHATLFADQLLKEGVADIIIRGEGEVSMLEVVLAMDKGKDLKDIKGISFIHNGTIFHNPERKVINSLDELPYPAWHLFDLNFYQESPLRSIKGTTLMISASRGCLYRCIFCAQDKIYKKPRYRKVKSVVDEIEYMHNKLQVNCFGFNDPCFPASLEYGLEFANELINRGLHRKIKWFTESRVDLVNLDLLKRLKESGLYLVMYGFEVGSQKILNDVKKRATLEQARIAAKYTKKCGILIMGLFMLGLPGETKENCKETIKFAKELDCDLAKFSIATPYPGSELYERYSSLFTDICNNEPEKFNSYYAWISGSNDIICLPGGMGKKELLDLQRKAMLQFYLRPKLIIRHILKATTSFHNLYFGFMVLMIQGVKLVIRQRRSNKS